MILGELPHHWVAFFFLQVVRRTTIHEKTGRGEENSDASPKPTPPIEKREILGGGGDP